MTTTYQPISLVHQCGQKLLETTDPSEEMPFRASIRGIEAEDVVYNQHLSKLHLETTARWNRTDPGSVAGTHLQRLAAESEGGNLSLRNITHLTVDEYIQILKLMDSTFHLSLGYDAPHSFKNVFDPKSALTLEKIIEDINLIKLWNLCSEGVAIPSAPQTPDEIREWLNDPNNARLVRRQYNTLNFLMANIRFLPPEAELLIDFQGNEYLISAFNGDLITLQSSISDADSAKRALYFAAMNNRSHIVAFLLSPEQNSYQISDQTYLDVLYYVIEEKAFETLQVMIDLRGEEYQLAAFNGDLETLKPLINDSEPAKWAFLIALISNQPHVISYLLDPEQNSHRINFQSISHGRYIAASEGYHKIFEILLFRSPISFGELDALLEIAVRNGKSEIVKCILEDPRVKSMNKRTFYSLFCKAIEKRDLKIIELFVRHEKIRDIPILDLFVKALFCNNEIFDILDIEISRRVKVAGKYLLLGTTMIGALYLTQYFSEQLE